MTAAPDNADPRDPVLWHGHAQALATRDALRETVLAAHYDDDAAQLLVLAAERAALASLDAGAAAGAVLAAALREGAACGGAAALCAARTEGQAELGLDDGRTRVFRAGGRAGMSGPRWALATAMASSAGDGVVLEVLTHPAAVAACQEGAQTADPFWTPYCVGLAALYRGDAAAGTLLQAAMQALHAPPRIADATQLAELRRPVLQLALQLAQADAPADAPAAGAAGDAAGDATGDATGDAAAEVASDALLLALQAHARYHGAGPGRGEALGLLAFELGGLCAWAQRAGHPLAAQPAALAALLPPVLPPRDAALVYRFAPRRILHDGEPHWFLDLQGFPRAGRRHVVGERDGVLQAIYEAQGAPGLPPSRVAFALPDASAALGSPGAPGAPAPPPWPLALDATALRGLLHSGTAQAHAEAEPLQQALVRYGVEHVGEAASTESTGRNGGGATAPAGNAQAMAMASAALICAEAMPLLQALVGAQGAALAAQLRPRPEDYAAVFRPEVAAAARQAFDAVWDAAPPHPARAAAGARITCHAAPAGMLADENALSRPFPGGYRVLAALLQPRRVWLAWKVIAPGRNAGMAYDGLVWLDDRWAWFPKPYRVMAALLKT
ncbi:hypothetical protein [Pseudorhodoferax soli]|uniref:Uncharacterized protein n=1 Tax=Pseudorhodoferax soli TaxID=545864 RepID=A0A368XBE1_9BURK|nr:hypothetical protein [Pseudorhodoferax soli]RCW65270.1 hypothetical protein DES41_113194 [Pseudorhodoferax soli]